jgi:hypothetical protein
MSLTQPQESVHEPNSCVDRTPSMIPSLVSRRKMGAEAEAETKDTPNFRHMTQLIAQQVHQPDAKLRPALRAWPQFAAGCG